MLNFDMQLTVKYASDYPKKDKVGKAKILSEYTKLTGVSRNTAVQRLRRKSRAIKPKSLDTSKNHKREALRRSLLQPTSCWLNSVGNLLVKFVQSDYTQNLPHTLNSCRKLENLRRFQHMLLIKLIT